MQTLPREGRFREGLLIELWKYAQEQGFIQPPRQQHEWIPKPTLNHQTMIEDLFRLVDSLPMPHAHENVEAGVEECLARCRTPELRELPVSDFVGLLKASL